MSSRPSSSRVALNFLIATRAPRRTLRRQAVEGFYERIYWWVHSRDVTPESVLLQAASSQW